MKHGTVIQCAWNNQMSLQQAIQLKFVYCQYKEFRYMGNIAEVRKCVAPADTSRRLEQKINIIILIRFKSSTVCKQKRFTKKSNYTKMQLLPISARILHRKLAILNHIAKWCTKISSSNHCRVQHLCWESLKNPIAYMWIALQRKITEVQDIYMYKL